MNDPRIGQMIDQQLTGQDPFAQARNIYDQRAQAAQADPMQMAQLGSPMNPQGMQQNQVAPSQPQTPAIPVQSVSLAGSLNSDPSMDFAKSGLPKMLQKIGVDDKGIAMNDLGRIQLMSRLKNKFGGDYQKNTDAMDALSQFDKHLKQFPMDTAKDMNSTIASGERTLKALLGGG